MYACSARGARAACQLLLASRGVASERENSRDRTECVRVPTPTGGRSFWMGCSGSKDAAPSPSASLVLKPEGIGVEAAAAGNASMVLVAVGTYTPTIHLFSLDSRAALTPVATSTEFGSNHEAIVLSPVSGDTATLVVANNNAASTAANGISGPEHLQGETHMHTARVSAAGNVEPCTKLLLPGEGPIHACVHPSGTVAIANYVGGTMNLVADGTVVSTEKLAEPNHGGSAHMATFDVRAGAKGFVFGVNAGSPPSVAVIEPSTGKILHAVAMPVRVRRLFLHPSLPVAYIIYEAEGDVATWTWPRSDEWNADGTPQRMPKELQRCKTSPHDGLNLPTSFSLTAKGDFGYTTTRTARVPGGDGRPPAPVGVFEVDAADGTLTHRQWVDSGGWNTRDSVLSPDDSALLAVDVLGGTLTAFKRDPTSGMLEKSAVVSAPKATGITVWKPAS